ncbi:MAG TPA: RluA family pseudouridine synthase [Patescibacteria group bacterium]|nr:RluA family pseudouridine synthase [Patescibacteria group bacterium]
MTRFTILHEDDTLLILDKPSGMIVNRADTTRYNQTVQDMLDAHFNRKPYYSSAGQKSDEEIFKERSGIVHRLDKETSGILLIAKTVTAFLDLQKAFQERKVKKTYLALAHGQLSPSSGEVTVPVGRLPFNRKRFGVVPGGKESMTRYTVLQRYQDPKTKEVFSFIKLFPQTGRTHQIRVHLKHLNHPIFADELYAGRKTARSDRKILQRLFLHATEISFAHPASGQQLVIFSPLPDELQLFLQTLMPVP